MGIGRCGTLALVVLATTVTTVGGQQLGAGFAGVLESPDRAVWSLGYSPPALGPLEATFSGMYYTGEGRNRFGGGLDLSLFRRGPGRWSVVAGVQGGAGTGTAPDTWTAWSAGLGFRLLRVGAVDLGLEAKYLHQSDPDDALVFGARLSVGLGRRGPTASPTAATRPLATAIPTERSPAAQAVIQTALDMMGAPYAWGGSSANGFDCSGLIQYAYQAHGVQVARRSVDQAREGRAVARNPAELLPGDILTFAERGSRISHVGLYLGEGRFIHSASGGVQVSGLSADDPTGGYWWRRWVGARRILPDQASP